MDFKNVKLDDYCFNLELHKSMFFIDMLKDTYEFTLKGDEVEIFKKLKNGISEPITRKELIYSIQVEMAEKYEYSSIDRATLWKVARAEKFAHRCEVFQGFRDLSNEKNEERKLRNHQYNVKKLFIMFYHQFETVDSIHKAIDNMVYLEKRLKRQPVIVQKQPPQKVIASASPKKPEFGGWEEDEESSDEEEVNELGENKKLVLKNALEKECLLARTELFRPAWTPPR